MQKTARLDLYGLIHKAQRNHLFALGSKIGRADLTEAAEIESIEQELREMIAHLREHSHHEDTFVHPLYREIGDAAALIDEEHGELEGELDKLEEILNQKNWQKLYSQFNRFLACYLSHQDEEEQMQASILWKHFDDARLATVFVAFNAERTPETKAADFAFIVPGLNVPEVVEMLLHVKASASPAAFESTCQIAEAHLEPDRWSKIRSHLFSIEK